MKPENMKVHFWDKYEPPLATPEPENRFYISLMGQIYSIGGHGGRFVYYTKKYDVEF